MTREEASKHLVFDWYVEEGRLVVCGDKRSEFQEAVGIAVSALRAQQTPLDRSRRDGCDACRDRCELDYFEHRRFVYCPYCGRPLTEDAWAELERRINGGKAD